MPTRLFLLTLVALFAIAVNRWWQMSGHFCWESRQTRELSEMMTPDVLGPNLPASLKYILLAIED